MIVLPRGPFSIYQETEALLEGKLIHLWILQLLLKPPRHSTEVHILQLGNGFVRDHHLSLLL